MQRLGWGIFFVYFWSTVALAADFWPLPLVQLDPFFTHHILVAEKSTHQLHLFAYTHEERPPELIKSYPMATGKKAGDKIFQGDHRTPEGIYALTQFIDHQQLAQRYGRDGIIYGQGAFVLNYPNPIDKEAGKSGGGIWIHSTNDETRIDKGLDSRGCVVIGNKDLIDLATYIELNKTMIVVVHDLHYVRPDTRQADQQELQNFLNNWLKAWNELDLNNYLAAYDPQKFEDPVRGRFAAFKAYKKRIFGQSKDLQVAITDVSLVRQETYVVVTFRQHYKSATIKDIGKKTLYLVQDEYYRWKIVAEIWQQFPDENPAEFQPSQRFFVSQG
jgi:murein L,D-transpeptidase YafK